MTPQALFVLVLAAASQLPAPVAAAETIDCPALRAEWNGSAQALEMLAGQFASGGAPATCAAEALAGNYILAGAGATAANGYTPLVRATRRDFTLADRFPAPLRCQAIGLVNAGIDRYFATFANAQAGPRTPPPEFLFDYARLARDACPAR